MNEGGASIVKEREKGTKAASQVYMGHHTFLTEPPALSSY